MASLRISEAITASTGTFVNRFKLGISSFFLSTPHLLLRLLSYLLYGCLPSNFIPIQGFLFVLVDNGCYCIFFFFFLKCKIQFNFNNLTFILIVKLLPKVFFFFFLINTS